MRIVSSWVGQDNTKGLVQTMYDNDQSQSWARQYSKMICLDIYREGLTDLIKEKDYPHNIGNIVRPQLCE